MSTPNKCPKCGADSVGNHGEGWFSCWSHRSHKEPSPLCRERTAHAETRKREDALKLQFDQAVAQRDFWEKRCDEKDAEIAKEHAAHAETRKERDTWHIRAEAHKQAAEAKLADALADAASWQKQADDRLNDAVEFGRRAENAEARVKELEGLPVLIAKESGKAVWFSVQIPHDRWIEDGATLGAAMPRKEP